ncbi:2Fe-2S iron-sulfur cluster-binding protein, partial [Streptomyces sp. NPDC005568]|uniref:2Fe-2S iron-sulfur cluster-binding protein n=1 Tax=Streptomyces sp. NPDC005568 TaxID=3156887 RepID=UPI0033ACBB07
LGGLPDRARELLDAAGCEDLPEALRGAAELVRGLLSLGDGPVADARETLLLAAELLAPHDSARSRAARLAAMEAAWAAGDAAAYVEALEHPSARTDPDRRLAGYRAGMAAVMRGRLHAGRERLRGYLASGATDAADDPERLLRTGVAALVVGDLAAAGRINSRALAVARARGPYILVPQALEHLAYGELRAGRHARARAHAEEGLRSALATGQHNIAAHHHAILALAASVEGDPGAVAEHATAAERVVTTVLAGRTSVVTVLPQDEVILDAVLRHRPEAPYACRDGVCGSCRATVVRGAVTLGPQHALDADDLAAGYTLACRARPRGEDLTLDFDA